MKKYFVILWISLIVIPAYVQCQNSILKDTGFTLLKNIKKDRFDIGRHGVIFESFSLHYPNDKQIEKDFNYMEKTGKINFSGYNKKLIFDSNYLIKVYKPIQSDNSVKKIIEIDSYYIIDTVERNYENKLNRYRDTIIFYDYYIKTNDKKKDIWYETIDNQGVNKYKIGERNVCVKREMIRTIFFYIKRGKERNSLAKKNADVEECMNILDSIK